MARARWLATLPGLLLFACAAARADALSADSHDPAIAAIRYYQRHLSSLRRGRCRFTPSCSEYAAQAIARDGFVVGSARAADRLVRCNASAPRFYARDRDGRLEDPVDAREGAVRELRTPRWLWIAPESRVPPVPADLESGRRARLDEAVAFAGRLVDRGDCERAATEFQRAASLAGTPAAESWAFARIGECDLAASQWAAADRAFLTAGTLAPTDAGRARAAYRAAVSRLEAGAFTACARMLDDPVLAIDRLAADRAREALGPGAGPAASDRDRDSLAASAESAPHPDAMSTGEVPADRVATLASLCAMARGDWTGAAAGFSRATSLAHDEGERARIVTLATFVDRGPRLPHRSAGVASALSCVVPGAGQVYAGRTRDGVRHLLFNAALIATVVSFARDDRWPAASIAAGIELPFYLGAVIGAGDAARAFDRDRRLGLVRQAARESER